MPHLVLLGDSIFDNAAYTGGGAYTGDGAEFKYCPPGCGCRANKVARMKEEAMTMDGSRWGLPVRFAGESKIGTNWKAV